jgi:hypothetical protein
MVRVISLKKYQKIICGRDVNELLTDWFMVFSTNMHSLVIVPFHSLL